MNSMVHGTRKYTASQHKYIYANVRYSKEIAMIMKLIIGAVLVAAAYVVFKLKMSGKAVTVATVAEGVKSEAQKAADAVKADIAKK